MSTTPPDQEMRPSDTGGGFLARSDEGRIFTGVCAGLGRYAGIDPVLVRVGFAVLALGSGTGVFLYVAAFLLMRHPDGGRGFVEQWTDREFDSQTVLALLTAVLGAGLAMNLFADTTGPGTIVVGTMIAIALLAARSRGVDLVALARSLPDRLSGGRARRRAAMRQPHPTYDPAHRTYEPAEPAEPPEPAEPVEPAGHGAPPHAAPSQPAPSQPATSQPATSQPATSERPAEATQPTVVLPTVPAAEAPATAPSGAQDDGYRRLKDLAQQARTSSYASQEPFAPRGPYGSRTRYAEEDPSGYGGHAGYGDHRDYGGHGGYGGYEGYGHRPYDPVPGAPAAAPARKRPRSYVGALTIFIAMLVGGIMVATQPAGSGVNFPLAGGAVLITIGAGLLVAAWFGRGAGLIAAGTIVSLALIAGGTLDGVPKRMGSYTWAPTTTAEALQERYEVGVGDITLDLRKTEAAPGSRTRLEVRIAVGAVEVLVPRTARVEVDASARVGDITVGRSIRSGAGLSVRTVLEPKENAAEAAPVYELEIRGGLSDVEVRHAR